MEKKRHWNEELRSVLPEKTVVTESEETTLYTFPYLAGCNEAEVSIKLHSGYAILRAQRKYVSGIREKETVHFVEQARSDYFGYQIFTERNIVYVTKRFTFEKTEELLGTIKSFLEILVNVVETFELQCVDFSEKIIVTDDNNSMETNEIHIIEEDTTSVAEFLKYQLYFCNDIFCKMAAKYEADIEVTDGELYFQTNIDNYDVFVSMKKETGDITIDFSFSAGENHAYRIISEFKKRKNDLYFIYLNGKVHVKSFLTPDPGLPDEAFCIINLILSLLKTLTDERNDISMNEIPVQMVSEMQTLMDAQMEALKKKSLELEKREKELLDKEKKHDERIELFRKEREQIKRKFQESEKEISKKEKELQKKENMISMEYQKAEEEKNKYLLHYRDLTNEIARLQMNLTHVSDETLSEEVFRLKQKVNSMNQARAALEKKHQQELEILKTERAELLRHDTEKQEKIRELTEHQEEKLQYLMKEERDRYEKEILKLKGTEDITGHEINIDSFITFIKACGTYKSVKKLPALNQQIAYIESEKNVIKVVFGKLLFVDVIRNIPRCRDKELALLNTQYPSVKIFMRQGAEGKEAVARQYFDKSIQNNELENMISELIGLFE